MVNLSASPWHHGKRRIRERVVTDTARALACPVVYCNAVGGNDEIIFDGRSLVTDAQGRLLAELPAVRPCTDIVEVEVPAPAENAVRITSRNPVVGGDRPGQQPMLVGLEVDSVRVA